MPDFFPTFLGFPWVFLVNRLVARGKCWVPDGRRGNSA